MKKEEYSNNSQESNELSVEELRGVSKFLFVLGGILVFVPSIPSIIIDITVLCAGLCEILYRCRLSKEQNKTLLIYEKRTNHTKKYVGSFKNTETSEEYVWCYKNTEISEKVEKHDI